MARATADRGGHRRPAAADPGREDPPASSTTRWPRRPCRLPTAVTRPGRVTTPPGPRARPARSWPPLLAARRGRGGARRLRAHDGRPARRPRQPAARVARDGRRRRPRGRVDLRQPAAVRAGRGPRPLPAHPGRRPRDVCRASGVDVVFAPVGRRGLPRRRARRSPSSPGRSATSWRARPVPATSAACSPWSPSSSAWSGPTSRSSAQKDYQQLVLIRRMVADLCHGRRGGRRGDRARGRRAGAVQPQPLPRRRPAPAAAWR